MQVFLDHKKQLSSNIWTLYFRVPHRPRYDAGQFIELTVPHNNPDNRGMRHWFTLSSSPTEELLAITTRHVQPSSTFKKALFEVEAGTELTMSDPMGDFVLPRDKSIPLLFVIGGIGVTPLRSIAKSLTDTGENRSIQLLYAASAKEDLIFLDDFAAANITAEVMLKNPPKGWTGLTGQIQASDIVERSHFAERAVIYMSGPEPLVESLTTDLVALGYSEHRLVRDYFPGYDIGLS